MFYKQPKVRRVSSFFKYFRYCQKMPKDVCRLYVKLPNNVCMPYVKYLNYCPSITCMPYITQRCEERAHTPALTCPTMKHPPPPSPAHPLACTSRRHPPSLPTRHPLALALPASMASLTMGHVTLCLTLHPPRALPTHEVQQLAADAAVAHDSP